MRRTVVSSLFLVAIACGGKSPAPAPAPPATAGATGAPATTTPEPAPAAGAMTGAVVIARFGEFRDRICACKDQACVDLTHKAMMDWATAHMEELKAIEPTEAEDAEADRIEDEMDACNARIAGASTPSVTANEILAKMEELKDQVCACKDAACIDQAEQAMVAWAMSQMEAMKDLKPTRAEDEQADRIERELDACKARITGTP